MRSLSEERHLKDLQQTFYRLLNVYSELKEVLENTQIEHEKKGYLIEIEQQLENIKNEISHIKYMIQILKTK